MDTFSAPAISLISRAIMFPFLDGLRGSSHSLYVAFKNNIGHCRLEDVNHIHKSGMDMWSVRFRIEESDFSPTMEMGFQGLSADEIAENYINGVST